MQAASPENSEWLTRKQLIDGRLRAAGWAIVPFKPGKAITGYEKCAVEEYQTPNGPADYALCLGGQIVGVVEAKKLTLGPQNVLSQAERYSKGISQPALEYAEFGVPFLYSTNGEVIWHHDTELLDHYNEVLRKLRDAGGLLGDIFTQANSRFNNPVNLRRLIDMIDDEQWSALDVDVKGAAFEGLLEKAASEGKKGAGQYFTPRPLIQSICRVMKPDPRGKPDFKICDPACGTGGFLVAAYEWLISPQVSKGVFERAEARRIRTRTYYGQDLVPRPRRLALMNLYLHGVEPHIYLGDSIYEPDRGERYDVVLTN